MFGHSNVDKFMQDLDINPFIFIKSLGLSMAEIGRKNPLKSDFQIFIVINHLKKNIFIFSFEVIIYRNIFMLMTF